MFMTANPCADAERWENEQDRREQERQAQLERAEKFFLQALSCPASAWYSETVKTTEKGALMSPCELLEEVTWREQVHKSSRKLLAELLTSEAAKALREEAARLLAQQFPDAGDQHV